MRKNLWLYFAIFLALAACKDDDENRDSVFTADQPRVFVLNEGNFQFGNAGVSLYLPKQKEVTNDFFQRNNSNRPIGDVVQSMEVLGDKGFIVVNNSSKIEVVRLSDFKALDVIAPLNSPRYLLPVSGKEALVSDLHEGKLSRVDLKSFEILGEIETGGWTEEMVRVGQKAFVCQTDLDFLLVIDLDSMKVTDRIPTHREPHHLVKDQSDKLWVACTGGLQHDTAALMQIDPNTHEVLKSLFAEKPSKRIHELEINSSKDELFYFSDGGLYQVSIGAAKLPSEPLINDENGLFYGLGVNPFNDEIYIADAIDFQQRGVVFRYSPQAVLIDHFRAGIIPGDFAFDE